MPDNLTQTTQISVTEAYDDVGGVLYPRTKVSFGTDGQAIDVSGTSPLPVSFTGGGTTVISGTVPVTVTNPPSGTTVISGTVPVSFAGTSSVIIVGTPAVTANLGTITVNISAVTLGAGEDLPNNVQKTESRFGNVGPVSASGIVKSGAGRFSGFICTASSSGVVRLWDNTTATGTKILDSLAVSAGQIITIPGGCTPFANGLYLELVSGTATITPFFN